MNVNSVRLFIGSETGSYNLQEVKSFLEEVNKASVGAVSERKRPDELTHFVKGKISETAFDLDFSHTMEVLNELKEKISTFDDNGLTSLFEKTLGVVTSVKMSDSKAPAEEIPIPYIGDSQEWVIENLFESEKPGTFVFYTLWSKPGLVIASTKLNSGQILTYSLKPDPSTKEGMIVDGVDVIKHSTLVEARFPPSESPLGKKFESIEDFVRDNIKEVGFFKTAYQPEEPFNFEKKTAECLEQEPYFPDLDFIGATNYLSNRKDGTYLIRNKESEKNTQVVMYVENDEIKRFELTPGKGPLKGFDFNDEWYPSLEKLFSFNSKIFDMKFRLSLEEVEASFAIEKMHKEVEHLEIKPKWKHEIYELYRNRLEEGKESINTLLTEAFKEGEFEVVKWLVNKGASIKSLEPFAVSSTEREQLDWLNKYLEKPDPKPGSLNHYGLEVGYGFKSANLMVQERYVNKLNEKLKVAKVQVPPFIPISDFEMQTHLTPLMPKVDGLWNEFLDTFDPKTRELIINGKIDPVATPIQIALKGRVILETIQTEIKKYFLENPYDTPELRDWMKNNPSEFLIIRSTGKEDTEENPNPGGNETIPYVKPEAYQISNSIAQVVSSYFGIKSVTQRLMVGDKTVFTEKPFMPVLVMNMVTEKVNGEGSSNIDIPRSGVMFTRQNGKAEGVTLLQVGLGNNEGVVGSKVAVDTHYIDSKGNINSIIRDKKTRFVPLQTGVSGPITVGPLDNNNPALEVSQGLADPIVKDMKITADFFAEKYRKSEGLPPAAMDMEYTIQLAKGDGKPVISLLQIRPLVEKEISKPSYLNLSRLQEISVEKKVSSRTLLGGSSSVEDIASLDDVMFVDNLSQGLSRYLKTAYKKVKVKSPEATVKEMKPPKILFTKKTAHLTSHEAIFFRKRGVVVFLVDDPSQMEALKKMVGRATIESPVKADPQRGVLVDTNGVVKKEELVTGGFISYPIPREISLPEGLFNPIDKEWTPREIQVKLQLLNERYTNLDKELRVGEGYFGSTVSNRELFDIVATSPKPEDAKRALGTILRRLNTDLKASIAKTEGFRGDVNLPLIQIFDAATFLAEKQIIPNLTNPPGHPNRLFPLKFLDALIFQEQSATVVGGKSWKSVKQVDVGEKRAIKTAGKYGVTIEGDRAAWQVQLQMLGNVAFNENIRENWTAFTKELIAASEENPKVLELAGLLIKDVVGMNLASDWVNLVFNPVWAESALSKDRSVEVLKELVKIYATDKKTLNWVKEKRVKLSRNKEQIGEWSNPKFTRKNIDHLRNQFRKNYGFEPVKGTSPFADRYHASDKMGRLALLGFYREAIDIYDKTLKSISESNEYPSDNSDKAKDFSKLLVGYYHMLEGTIHMVSKEDEKVMMHHKWENSDPTFDGYLHDLEHGVKKFLTTKGGPGLIKVFKEIRSTKEDQSDQFVARSEFNVEALAIGSHADYSYNIVYPHTLEEFFTTIHQNLERVGRHLVTKEGLNGEVLEGMPRQISSSIQDVFGQEPSTVSLSGSILSVRYNIPLRQHSCSIELQFDVNNSDKGATVRGMVFGANEHARWDKAAGVAAILGNIADESINISAESSPEIEYQNPKSSTFTFHINKDASKQEVESLMANFRYMFRDISFEHFIKNSEILYRVRNDIPRRDWHKVKETAYEDALHFDTLLMEQFSSTKDQELVARVAKGAFVGLLKRGLDDYQRDAEVPKIPGYTNDPNYSFVPGNDGKTGNSLKLTATLYLIKGLKDDRKVTEPVVKSLLENPQFTKKFPETAKALNSALFSLK